MEVRFITDTRFQVLKNITGISHVLLERDLPVGMRDQGLAHGGHGCISVTANVAPALCVAMHEAWQTGDTNLALEIHDQLTPLNDALFVETSPGPVKYALSLLGHCLPELRLPMTDIKGSTKELVHAALESVGLLDVGEKQWQAAT